MPERLNIILTFAMSALLGFLGYKYGPSTFVEDAMINALQLSTIPFGWHITKHIGKNAEYLYPIHMLLVVAFVPTLLRLVGAFIIGPFVGPFVALWMIFRFIVPSRSVRGVDY